MAEGEGTGRCREARVPAVLEMLGIPYTGSDPLTLAATLDKEVAKRLVAEEGLSVPNGFAFSPGANERGFRASVARLLGYEGAHLILKPNSEGSSKGILARCLAATTDEAWQTYLGLSGEYRQAILVEEYIPGEEVTVGLVGNGKSGEIEVIGAMRVIPKVPDPHFIYSLEVKRDWRRRVDYEAPAVFHCDPWEDQDIRNNVEHAARHCYARLGCCDVARIDFRVHRGNPFFIEANPLPGLSLETSDLVILAKGHGIKYESLIGRVFEAALARLGINEHAHGANSR
jgi:D-alanine-D-alanine ligase